MNPKCCTELFNNLDPVATSVGSSLNLTALTDRLWVDRVNLRVRFLNGDNALRTRIMKAAQTWSTHCRINFIFGDFSYSDIRVNIDNSGYSNSFVGTDAYRVPQNARTMNFGWFDASTPDDELTRTVLHEFGHALGLVHEHQSPGASIKWNKEAVYRYYANQVPPWSHETVDVNVFSKYDRTLSNSSQYDAKSIMNYPIRKEFTTDGYESGWNDTLSATDIAFIGAIYPKRTEADEEVLRSLENLRFKVREITSSIRPRR